jgi:hypothetical protein
MVKEWGKLKKLKGNKERRRRGGKGEYRLEKGKEKWGKDKRG